MLDDLAFLVTERDRNALLQQSVFVLIEREQRLRGAPLDDLPDGIAVHVLRQSRIQLDQLFAKRARQHDFTVAGAAERALRAEGLLVVRIHQFPAEIIAQVARGLLDEGVFGVARHSGLVLSARRFLADGVTLRCPLSSCCDVHDLALFQDIARRSGAACDSECGAGRAFECRLRPPQILVFRSAVLPHSSDPHSSMSGCAPELSYSTHPATSG